MPGYRRNWVPGGTYFFTVNLLQRQDSRLLVEHIESLREAVRACKAKTPFDDETGRSLFWLSRQWQIHAPQHALLIFFALAGFQIVGFLPPI